MISFKEGRFADAWQRRTELRGAALRAWDVGPRGLAGAHKWLTDDLVLTECLIAEPHSFRLAEPFLVLAGDLAAVGGLQRRAPIARAEVEAGTFVGDSVELLYDALKCSVRGDHTAARRVLHLLEEEQADRLPSRPSRPAGRTVGLCSNADALTVRQSSLRPSPGCEGSCGGRVAPPDRAAPSGRWLNCQVPPPAV